MDRLNSHLWLCLIFSLLQLSKQYGSVYTVHLGPKKVVILSGYKTIKHALVNLSEEFGDRDITPIFHDFNQGYGERHLFCRLS